MRCPGIEPGSTAWKAAMLTTIPTSLDGEKGKNLFPDLSEMQSNSDLIFILRNSGLNLMSTIVVFR